MAHLLRSAKRLPFCPGCSGHGLARKLDQAFETMGLGGLDICLVTDIGCNGLMDQYFDTLAFHGLHGRSITYATGIHLAQPNLRVVVIMGDGGTGIGGGHLLSAARRDANITLIIMNNFNYGMTGGQHSATTPDGCVTSTTPYGNVEKPLDICAAVMAAGGRFAARKLVSDDDLSDVIARAVSHKGFSVVDMVGPCTAYFMPRNKLRRSSELLAMCEKMGWKFGVLTDEPGEDFLARYRAAVPKAAPAQAKDPEKSDPSSHGLEDRTEVVIAATAGNRVRFAGTLLAQGIIEGGGWAVQKDDYPITVRSGYSVTHLVLAPEPIAYIGVDAPNVVAVASPEGLARVAPLLKGLSPDSLVLADEGLSKINTPAKVERYPIGEIAKPVDRNLVALVSAVLIARKTGIISLDAMRRQVSSRGSEAVRKSNLEAFDKAAEAFGKTFNSSESLAD